MPTPKLVIDPASQTPAYRQIVDQFRTLLVEGAIESGEPLPSVRRLAQELGIHFNTVAEAYRTLGAEGWITVSHGKAARVIERDHPMATPPELLESFRLKLRQLVAEMRAKGVSKARIRRELSNIQETIQS